MGSEGVGYPLDYPVLGVGAPIDDHFDALRRYSLLDEMLEEYGHRSLIKTPTRSNQVNDPG